MKQSCNTLWNYHSPSPSKTAQSQAVPRTFCGMFPAHVCGAEERPQCARAAGTPWLCAQGHKPPAPSHGTICLPPSIPCHGYHKGSCRKSNTFPRVSTQSKRAPSPLRVTFTNIPEIHNWVVMWALISKGEPSAKSKDRKLQQQGATCIYFSGFSRDCCLFQVRQCICAWGMTHLRPQVSLWNQVIEEELKGCWWSSGREQCCLLVESLYTPESLS